MRVHRLSINGHSRGKKRDTIHGVPKIAYHEVFLRREIQYHGVPKIHMVHGVLKIGYEEVEKRDPVHGVPKNRVRRS